MELRAERMITRSLTQHRKAFEAIYLDDKDDLNRFIASWRGFGYMVVSTKAFIDGGIVAQESGGSSISATAHVPVDAVMGASTAILPAISTGLVGFSAGIYRGTAQKFTRTLGEQGFAVSYRTVKIRKQWLSRPRELRIEFDRSTIRPASGKSSGGSGSSRAGQRRSENRQSPPTYADLSPSQVNDNVNQDIGFQDTSNNSVAEPERDFSDGSPNETVPELSLTIIDRAEPIFQIISSTPVESVKVLESLNTHQSFRDAFSDLKTLNIEVVELDESSESDSPMDKERHGAPAHPVLVTDENYREVAGNLVVFDTLPTSGKRNSLSRIASTIQKFC